MSEITPSDLVKAPNLLSQPQLDREIELRQYSKIADKSYSDDECGSESWIFYTFYLDGRPESILNRTILEAKQFTAVFGRFSEFISQNWNVRRG